jgi:predicted PurR-regulated permease PerM
MLSTEEEKFISYWSQKRERKMSVNFISLSMPIAVIIVAALFINIFTGWHKRAFVILRSNASLIIFILIAVIGIVIFITVVSGSYQWEQNEQRYKELLSKRELTNRV